MPVWMWRRLLGDNVAAEHLLAGLLDRGQYRIIVNRALDIHGLLLEAHVV